MHWSFCSSQRNTHLTLYVSCSIRGFYCKNLIASYNPRATRPCSTSQYVSPQHHIALYLYFSSLSGMASSIIFRSHLSAKYHACHYSYSLPLTSRFSFSFNAMSTAALASIHLRSHSGYSLTNSLCLTFASRGRYLHTFRVA